MEDEDEEDELVPALQKSSILPPQQKPLNEHLNIDDLEYEEDDLDLLLDQYQDIFTEW